MALSTVTNETRYTGSGNNGPFPIPWRFNDAAEIQVLTVEIATGAETTLAEGVDYAVDPLYTGREGGGFLSSTEDVESTHEVVVRRILEVSQPLNYREQGGVSAREVEVALDRVTKIDQQQQSQIDRRIAFPEAEEVSATARTIGLKEARKGKILGFNEDTGDVEMVTRGDGTGGGLTVVAAGTGIEVAFDEPSNTYTVGLFSAFAATLSGGSDHEKGSSVATVSLTWSYNKAITSQTLAGTGAATPLTADRAQTVTGPFTTDVTWTVTGSTASETDGDTTSLLFKSKRYWGVSALTTLTDAQIIALAGSELSTAFAQSRSLSPSAQYMYFAFPTAWGTPSFTVNGLLNTAWSKVRSASAFVNASGATVNYDVWRSDNLLSSTYTVSLA